jgi:hypothetical protein
LSALNIQRYCSHWKHSKFPVYRNICRNITIKCRFSLLYRKKQQFGDLSVENVSELNCMHSMHSYKYMHSALTGVQVLVTRAPEHAYWLASICWGLLIVTEEKGKAIEMSFSCSFIGSFFSGGQQGAWFYVWLWYTPLVQIR